MSALASIGGWPLTAILVAALLVERRRALRRRRSLNRALHELRRPLQLLAMSRPAAAQLAPLELTIAAVAQLDREINGGEAEEPRLVFCRELVGGAVSRWRDRAVAEGGSIALRWRTDDAPVLADPARISQALDNLIVNALQHGGSHVLVDARAVGGRLRIAIADDGALDQSQGQAGLTATRISQRRSRRHGHGLDVVRSIVAAHRGRFALQRSERGSVAVLDLPLAGAGGVLAA
jgi:two-component system sensor histidine kinase HydH